MKILFIITQSEIGGAQRYLLELAKYLSKKGHELIITAGEGDRELFEQISIFNFQFSSTPQKAYYIPNLVRNLNPVKDAISLFKIFKIIKKERPDVLFLQSTKAGFLGSLAAKFFKIRVIYRIGGWSFRDPRSVWMNKILFYMEKISASWKDVIVVNSEFDKKIAVSKKIAPADKIIKIYNGVDPDMMEFLEREEARDALVSSIKYPVSSINKEIVVGTIANLYATKGLEYLIESAHNLYQILNTKYSILFIVIGEGKERSKLESLIKKYNLETIFFLVGRKQDAYKYLRAFDIFALPSIKEGMPWAILEAMAAGVPIISTKTGAIPEIITNGKEGFLVEPGDNSAIAEKIKMLIDNPELRSELSKNALKKLEKFSLGEMLEKSEKIITQ